MVRERGETVPAGDDPTGKSLLVQQHDIAGGILRALAEEVVRLGGDDHDLRRIVTDEKRRRQIAQLLVDIKTLFAPINYDNPAHRRIDRDQYYYVDDDLGPEHFPICHTGQVDAMFEYLTFDHEPTTQEVYDEVERRGDVELLDFAATRDFHQANPDERKKAPVISLCGSVVGRVGDRYVAYVSSGENGLGLRWGWFDRHWDQRCRFLVVRKNEYARPVGMMA